MRKRKEKIRLPRVFAFAQKQARSHTSSTHTQHRRGATHRETQLQHAQRGTCFRAGVFWEGFWFFFSAWAMPWRNDIIASWFDLGCVLWKIIFCFLSPRQGYFAGGKKGIRSRSVKVFPAVGKFS